MKVCFVGIGSIARRHILNLSETCAERQIPLTIDLYRSGRGTVLPEEIMQIIRCVYRRIEDVPEDYDVIFITNPTNMHIDTLGMFGKKGKNFFIEKPIATIEQTKRIQKFPMEEGKQYYVACPLRYTRIVQYIKENVKSEEVYSARCISSSYLPDWRPGISYQQTYSAQKRLGGGVAADLIHEWDYIRYLFGTPQQVIHMEGKVSGLEIDSEDIAIYLAKYQKMFVEIHLDYFGRYTIRELQLFTAHDTLTCDFIKNRIICLKTGKVIQFEDTRNDYQKAEIRYFLDIIDGKRENPNTIEYAIETLKLTGGQV